MSSLLLGSATYFFRTAGVTFLIGVVTRECKEVKDSRGALAHVDELPVGRCGMKDDRVCEDVSDIEGDAGRLFSFAFRKRDD